MFFATELTWNSFTTSVSPRDISIKSLENTIAKGKAKQRRQTVKVDANSKALQMCFPLG